MANTAEQMEMFGYTPEGAKQEAEKYASQGGANTDLTFKEAAINVGSVLPGIGTAMTVAEIEEELKKEDPSYGKIALLGGSEVIGLIPGLGTAAKNALKVAAKKVGANKVVNALDSIPEPKDPAKTELFGGVSMEGAAKDKNLKKAIKTLKTSDFYKDDLFFAAEQGAIPYNLNKQIWDDTGWYVDPADGQWRYFIDDTKASLKNLDQISNIEISPDARKPINWKSVKISDIFDHSELYERYPEFKDFEIAFYNANPKNSENLKLLGSYDELTNTLEVNMGADAHRAMVNGKYITDVDSLKRTLLHELQHVIQRKENFVRGSSEYDIPPDLVYDKDRELRGKKKPIQKKFDEAKSEFDLTDNQLREARKAAGENPLPGLTIQQEIEIYNKHYSQPDKLRPDVTWASTAREYGVPVSVVQKAAGRTNLIGRLNRKLAQQGKVYNKLADEVYDVDRERSRIEINFYEGAGGEIEARLTEEMLSDPYAFPIDARAGMLEREGDLYEYQGKYGVDPFNYEVKPRREPESTNLIDTVKNKLGLSDSVKPTKATLEDYGYYQDNPATKGYEGGEDWVKKQQKNAEEDAANASNLQGSTKKFLNGPTTATLGMMDDNKPLFLDTDFLAKLSGANDEVRKPGISKYDYLRDEIERRGFDPKQRDFYGGTEEGARATWRDGKIPENRVVVGVNHKGEAFLVEGNTRTAVAKDLGVPNIRAEVKYWNGAETVDGPYSPQNILKYASKESKNFAEGGVAMDGQMEMAFMNEGGLRDDNMDKDPVSGNEVPSGSMAKEVRDDIPAQLSEGEYVVPADVVRYYGVKFFEDLRDRAKRGLQEMEANGRIGGEPVPAGGPTNEEELSPQEMQAIREMMGMAEGGTVNMYKRQQDLYSAPQQAVGNNMMNEGGQVRGYQNSSVVTNPANTASNFEQNILTAGQQAQQNPFQAQPLGSSLFKPAGTGTQMAEVTTPTAFVPVKMINLQTNHRVTANTQKEFDDYAAKGYVVDDGTLKPDSGGGGGGGGEDPPKPEGWKKWLESADWNSEAGIRAFVDGIDYDPTTDSTTGKSIAAGLVGGAGAGVITAGLSAKPGLTAISDLNAARLIAKAQGLDDLAEELDTRVKKIIDEGPGILDYLDDIFASGKSKANAWAKSKGFDNIQGAIEAGVTPTTPKSSSSNDDDDPPNWSSATDAASAAGLAYTHASEGVDPVAASQAAAAGVNAGVSAASAAEAAAAGATSIGSGVASTVEETGQESEGPSGSGSGAFYHGGLAVKKVKKKKRQPKKGGLAGKK